MDVRRAGALAGIAGPVIFAAVYAVEGWLRPGYDSRNMFLSELSLGPRGCVAIMNLLAYGAALLVFARGMAAEFPDGKASRVGPIALRVSGIALLGAGVFVMDPLSTPLAELSWHGRLHGLGNLCTYAFPIACFAFLRRFREEPPWQALAPWTLAAGVVIAALVLSFKILLWSHWLVTGSLRAPWIGLLQRSIFVVWLAWQLAVAVKLGERSRVD